MKMDDDEGEEVCTLCYQNYSAIEENRIPRTLSCGHTFCTECVTRLKDTPVEDDYNFLVGRNRGDHVNCPVCKQKTEVPNNDLGRIPKNFALINVLEKVRGAGEARRAPKVKSCSEHADEDLRYWCMEKGCGGKPVCSVCLLQGAHKGHAYKPLSDVSRSKREQLHATLDRADKQTENVQKSFDEIVEGIERLTSLTESTKRKIKEKFEQMRVTMKERENELLQEIEDHMDDDKHILDSQKQCVEEALEQGKTLCKDLRTVNAGHDLDILERCDEMLSSLFQFEDMVRSVPLTLLVSVQIRFSPTKDVLNNLKSYGKLHFDDPERPKVTPVGPLQSLKSLKSLPKRPVRLDGHPSRRQQGIEAEVDRMSDYSPPVVSVKTSPQRQAILSRHSSAAGPTEDAGVDSDENLPESLSVSSPAGNSPPLGRAVLPHGYRADPSGLISESPSPSPPRLVARSRPAIPAPIRSSHDVEVEVDMLSSSCSTPESSLHFEDERPKSLPRSKPSLPSERQFGEFDHRSYLARMTATSSAEETQSSTFAMPRRQTTTDSRMIRQLIPAGTPLTRDKETTPDSSPSDTAPLFVSERDRGVSPPESFYDEEVQGRRTKPEQTSKSGASIWQAAQEKRENSLYLSRFTRPSRDACSSGSDHEI